MKHLKIYENYNEIEIGDYVICESGKSNYNIQFKKLNDFIRNKIGKLIDIDNKSIPGSIYYIVEYDNIPDNISNFKRSRNESAFTMHKIDIINYSKDKNELESIINANKFNI